MNKIDRYKILIRYCKEHEIAKSQKDLGIKLGYHNESSFSQVINGKVDEPKDFINRLQNLVPNLNADWLLYEEGEMFKTTATSSSYAEADKKDDSEDEKGYMIPLVSAEATAGGLPLVDNPGELLSSMSSIRCPVQADLAMSVTGESMEPEYKDGSIVLLRKVDANLFIEWGHVYVLDTTNGAVMKEVQKSSEEDKVRCVSLNPDPKYASYEIPKSCIRGWFRVVYSMCAK